MLLNERVETRFLFDGVLTGVDYAASFWVDVDAYDFRSGVRDDGCEWESCFAEAYYGYTAFRS
jgi:hypothetical protein